ncbi:MAG: HD domain-containing protein [Synergistaceae bacterium]|nr:HD domain-containing protein [Synergistaceae bacterium]
MRVQLHGTAEKWLKEYIDSFRDENGGLHPLMEVKRTHSLRVRDNASQIASELGWSGEQLDCALTAALLHDTGRFPQFAEWGTYYDGASLDHGDLGEKTLMEHFPDEKVATYGRWEDILLAVRLHNKKELPAGITPAAAPLVQIVRDSDKLDVFRLVRMHVEEDRINELLPRIIPSGGYSEALVREVSSERRASYSNVRSLSDFLLVQLSWVFDLNYAPSFRMLRRDGVLSWMERVLPQDASVNGFIQSALHHALLGESA